MQSTQTNSGSDPGYVSAGPILAVMIAAALGVLLAVVLAPTVSPELASTLLGSSPKAYWYLSRATAFVALGLLWLSMVFGLLISDKIARQWPGAQAAFSLHEYVSLLGLGFAAFHALVLLGDRFINYKLVSILIPFAGQEYRPIWVGLGQVGLYAWAIISVSYYVKKRIGQGAWRFIHFLSFFNFAVAVMHGLASGTDTGSPWAQGAYWFFAGSVLFLTVYRVVSVLMGPEERRNPAVRSATPPAPPAPPAPTAPTTPAAG